MNNAGLGAILAAFTALSLCGCGGGQNKTDTTAVEATVPMLSAATTLLKPGVTLGQAYWPNGSTKDGPSMAAAAGVSCLINEDYHIHAHISIFVDGQSFAVPSQIGLGSCAFELHTHDASGVIHIETSTEKKFTLGQVFAVWGEPLTRTNVGGIARSVTVYTSDGTGKLSRYNDDIGQLPLTAHRCVYLVLGTAPKELPAFDWDGGL